MSECKPLVNGRDFSDEVERRGQLYFTYGAILEVGRCMLTPG